MASPSKTVSGSGLAKRVGVHPSTVTRLTEDGVLIRGKNGRYDLRSNLERWEQREAGLQQGQKLTQTAKVLHAALIQQRIRKAKAEADQMEGLVIPTMDVVREVTRVCHTIKSQMLGLPSQLAPLVVGLTPPEAETMIRDHVTKALERLSEMEWNRNGEPTANPRNWRIHPHEQEQALTAVLDKVGWVQRVIVNKRTGFVVDGHLRVAAAISRSEKSVPVLYIDLSEAEEKAVLASLDPIAAMAGCDNEKLAELLQDVEAGMPGLADAISDFMGIKIPTSNKILNESTMMETENECPKCGFKW